MNLWNSIIYPPNVFDPSLDYLLYADNRKTYYAKRELMCWKIYVKKNGKGCFINVDKGFDGGEFIKWKKATETEVSKWKALAPEV